MNYVVGSGPAGVAAASALLAQGREVTMIDGGATLEAHRLETVQTLRQLPPDQWPTEAVAALKGDVVSSAKGVQLKKAYGSEFAYHEAVYLERPLSQKLNLRTSLALGGLSNVWGAVLLPFCQQDLQHWPINVDDLAPHYRAVLSFMGMSAVNDDLEALLPLYSYEVGHLKLSRQAEQLYQHWSEKRERLENAGLFGGHSRLAVRTAESEQGPACVYCGLCLYGCPYDVIYNSAFTLKNFLKNPRFHYRKNTVLQTVSENPNAVQLRVRDEAGVESVLDGERVYLATGVISTARIVLESTATFDQPIRVKDSQYFIVPFLTDRNVPDVENEKLHTLCQLLLEINDPLISKHLINMQLYTYNDLFQSAFRRSLKLAYPLLRPLLNSMMGRLMAFQSYLHSDDSSQAEVVLKRGESGSRLSVRPVINPRTKQVVSRAIRKLAQNKVTLGGRPLAALASVGPIGAGNHLGGTFPMSRKPEGLQTDTLGRLNSWARIHIVDSSVLPSIPATTITLSVMANAHRIASAT